MASIGMLALFVCVCVIVCARASVGVQGPMDGMKLKTHSLVMVSTPFGNMRDPYRTAGCVLSVELWWIESSAGAEGAQISPLPAP